MTRPGEGPDDEPAQPGTDAAAMTLSVLYLPGTGTTLAVAEVPEAFAYIGTPIMTASGTAYHVSFPMYASKNPSGI